MGVWLDTPVGSRLALSGPFSVCPNTSARADHFFVFPLIYSHTQPHTTSHNLTPTHSHAHTLTHTHTHTHVHAYGYMCMHPCYSLISVLSVTSTIQSLSSTVQNGPVDLSEQMHKIATIMVCMFKHYQYE